MQKSLKSIVTPYGLYMGLALTFITVIGYAFNLELFTKWWLNIINLLVVLLFAVLAVKEAKKYKEVYFSFKQAFSAYFIPVAIGTLISTVVSLLIFNVIDPEAAQQLQEISVEMTRNMMEKFGVPESDIENAVAEMSKENPYSLKNYLMGYIFWLAFYAVVGLIVALIFREKNPNAV